ncbi:hypothetical protein BS78_01G345600 [Paspalum vaginatum]|nr:hypothetical protein BS78_01G345600 [Paspalum vaginatum]
MTPYRKEPKLIPAVLLLVSLLLLQAKNAGSSSSCSGDLHGGEAVRLLHGRRLLLGHGEVLQNGLMEHAGEGGGAEALGEEKREVITGPNPLHNRR